MAARSFSLSVRAATAAVAARSWRRSRADGAGLALIAGRCAVRLGASLALVALSLFPNLPRVAGQFSRALHPERLVDPHFAGSDEAVAELRPALANVAPGAPFSAQARLVNAYVRKRVAYVTDWDNYRGNIHDWPTAEEVWRRGSDDCDGIAILNASLLQRLGFDARLEYNAFHCWVTVAAPGSDAESRSVTVGGAISGATSSRRDGSMNWLQLGRDLLRPRTWTEGLSFPVWRLGVTIAAALAPWFVRRRKPAIAPSRLSAKALPHVCRRTISAIQMGAKGEVQPLETG